MTNDVQVTSGTLVRQKSPIGPDRLVPADPETEERTKQQGPGMIDIAELITASYWAHATPENGCRLPLHHRGYIALMPRHHKYVLWSYDTRRYQRKSQIMMAFASLRPNIRRIRLLPWQTPAVLAALALTMELPPDTQPSTRPFPSTYDNNNSWTTIVELPYTPSAAPTLLSRTVHLITDREKHPYQEPTTQLADLDQLQTWLFEHVTLQRRAMADAILGPSDPLNAALVYISLAANMWQESSIRLLYHMSQNSAETSQINLQIASLLASAWAAAKPNLRPMASHPTYRPPRLWQYDYLEYSLWAADEDLTHIRLPLSITPTGATYDNQPWPPCDIDTARKVADALINQAKEKQHYIPQGDFILSLEGTPYYGPESTGLAIHAEPTGLVAAPINAKMERGPITLWTPNREKNRCTTSGFDPIHRAITDALLAAFWHDLVVEGERVVIQAAGEPQPAADRPRGTDPEPTEAKPWLSTITLPRKKIIRLQGTFTWGTPADHELIRRRAHGVRGHLRRLPEAWHTSERATEMASRYGIVLPNGYTFVAPHARGDRGARSEERQPTITVAKGLLTISTLL